MYELISQVPPFGLLSIGIGLFLTGFSLYYLHLEIRLTLTEESSPATSEDNPRVLRAAERAYLWCGCIVLLPIGLMFVFMGYVSIHSCVIGDAAASAC